MVGAAAIGFLTAATGATGLAFSLLGALPKDGPSEVEVDKEDGAERKLSTPLTTASSVLNVKDDEVVRSAEEADRRQQRGDSNTGWPTPRRVA